MLLLLPARSNAGRAQAMASEASSPHHSEQFLNSIERHAQVQAPRLRAASRNTFIAHPSLLQQWNVINSDAAAAYNDWTNTVIVQPEMTIKDSNISRARIRSLEELYDTVGEAAPVHAAVYFHELSHAEWDFYVEEGVQSYDHELLKIFKHELPSIVKANRLSSYTARSLASEVFAYYREELLMTIFVDAAEIRMASGINSVKNGCLRRAARPHKLRDYSPSSTPYAERVQLEFIFIRGRDVNLAVDKVQNARINSALFRHAFRTLNFPQSRVELFRFLAADPRIQATIDRCLKSD